MADELRELILEHLTLVLIAMAVAIALAVPAGILATRRPGWRRAALGFANIMQTVPSLALFGFLIPIPIIGGIGKRTAIVALVLYALLPILRNTLAGILGVDAAVRESAVAMGMTSRQVLWQVEIPSIGAHHPGRDPYRHSDHDRRGHDRGSHRRRRA